MKRRAADDVTERVRRYVARERKMPTLRGLTRMLREATRSRRRKR